MYPLHDNDLDRLSREAAEDFEVEPGASGWDHLEKRLDVELPQKKKRRRFLFWLFFITATTGGALTALLTYKPVSPLGNNATGVVTPAQKSAASQQQPTATASINEAVRPGTATDNNSTPATTTPAQTPANANAVPGKTPNTIDNNGHEASVTTPSSATPKSNTAGANQTADATVNTSPDKNNVQSIAKTNNSNKRKPVSGTDADRSPLSLNYATMAPTNKGQNGLHANKTTSNKTGKKKGATNAGQQQQTISPAPDNTTTPNRGLTANDQQPTTTPAVVNNEPSTAQVTTPADSTRNNTVVPPAADSIKTQAKENNKKPAPKKDKNEKGFELGIMAGPDLSTVKFGPLYKPGYNFGLQVGYRFGNRWSVNTGLIYTKKWYKAKGKDFNYKNPTPWPIDKAEGTCSMWEIPVNVRYDVSFNTKRRWFVSTGLSTYLMDKENYDVYYTWGGSTTPYPTGTDSNTNYFFSILNLSAGMERSLGKHFSLQAEPYLKVPLKGLGMGSIRMDSYGINFTLKYKLGSRTK